MSLKKEQFQCDRSFDDLPQLVCKGNCSLSDLVSVVSTRASSVCSETSACAQMPSKSRRSLSIHKRKYRKKETSDLGMPLSARGPSQVSTRNARLPHSARASTQSSSSNARLPFSAGTFSDAQHELGAVDTSPTGLVKPSEPPNSDTRRRRPYPKQLRLKQMLQGQFSSQESLRALRDVSSEPTESIFRPGLKHRNMTKQILALLEEQKMLEQVNKLKYCTDMPLDDFVGYMERRHEARCDFRRKVNNSLAPPEAVSEGLHPEVRRAIEEHLQTRST